MTSGSRNRSGFVWLTSSQEVQPCEHKTQGLLTVCCINVLYLPTIKTLLKAVGQRQPSEERRASLGLSWHTNEIQTIPSCICLLTDIHPFSHLQCEPGVTLSFTSVSDCDLLQQTHIWLLFVSSYCDTKPSNSENPWPARRNSWGTSNELQLPFITSSQLLKSTPVLTRCKHARLTAVKIIR